VTEEAGPHRRPHQRGLQPRGVRRRQLEAFDQELPGFLGAYLGRLFASVQADLATGTAVVEMHRVHVNPSIGARSSIRTGNQSTCVWYLRSLRVRRHI
jgi:hypothetical protein